MAAIVILLAGVLVVVTGFLLLRRSHRRWLKQQTPLGVWIAATTDGRVMLEFEGEHNQGTYSQVTQNDGGRTREWGHWTHDSGHLQLLMMATDIKDHPRFAEDTPYRVSYVGPNRIKIDGVDRPGMRFERAPAGTTVNVE